MNLSPDQIVEELARNREVFAGLLNLSDAKVQSWKSEPGKWNLVEIVCHLYDEEREDFRTRVRHTLETPDQPFVPIDPAGWVAERDYASQDYAQKLSAFLSERDASVAWLRNLQNPNWDLTYEHEHFGTMTPYLFLCNWLQHDYAHLQQILRLKSQYLQAHASVSFEYAGG